MKIELDTSTDGPCELYKWAILTISKNVDKNVALFVAGGIQGLTGYDVKSSFENCFDGTTIFYSLARNLM
jgi:hypothetical protein